MTLAKLLNLWNSQVKITSTLQDSKLIRDDTCTAKCLTEEQSPNESCYYHYWNYYNWYIVSMSISGILLNYKKKKLKQQSAFAISIYFIGITNSVIFTWLFKNNQKVTGYITIIKFIKPQISTFPFTHSRTTADKDYFIR